LGDSASVKRHLVTLCVLVVVTSLTIATGSLTGVPAGVREVLGGGPGALAAGRVLSPLTSVLVADGAGMLVLSLVSAFVFLGVAEGVMGWWRTLVAYLATALAGGLLGALESRGHARAAACSIP
jgi:phosphatidylglycerol lysyltransferase